MTTTAPARLSWHRDEWGTYADGTDGLRYYVRRGTGRAPWVVEAFLTIEVAGVRTVKPGTVARFIDRHNDTKRLAQLIAEAYDVEPDRVAGQATNRLTRAIERAYELETIR